MIRNRSKNHKVRPTVLKISVENFIGVQGAWLLAGMMDSVSIGGMGSMSLKNSEILRVKKVQFKERTSKIEMEMPKN